MTPRALEQIIECLRELSDRQIQETLWAGKIPDQQSDFTEAVEVLFTDTGLGSALENHTTGFSRDIESKLEELSVGLKKVQGCGEVSKIINDPAMPHVRDLAAEILTLVATDQKGAK